jgi:hypothetical protein
VFGVRANASSAGPRPKFVQIDVSCGQQTEAKGMNLVAALRREERRLEKQIRKAQAAVAGVKAAMKVLRERNNTRPKRRLSAAARARISAAQKKRWAKQKGAK